MKNCDAEPTVASLLPDFARNNHGNLAEQNRSVGAQHGLDTRPATVAATAGTVSTAAVAGAGAALGSSVGPASSNVAVLPLLQQNNCLACHALAGKLVGPSFKDVSVRYAARPDATTYLSAKIRAGGSGAWGQLPMPPQSLAGNDAKAIAQWLAEGAHK